MKKILGIATVLISVMFAAMNWSKVIGTSNHPIPPDIEVMKSDTLNVYVRNTIFGFTDNERKFIPVEIDRQ